MAGEPPNLDRFLGCVRDKWSQLFYSKEQLVLKHGGNLKHLKITHPLPHHGSKIVFDEFDGLIDHNHWSATTV